MARERRQGRLSHWPLWNELRPSDHRTPGFVRSGGALGAGEGGSLDPVCKGEGLEPKEMAWAWVKEAASARPGGSAGGLSVWARPTRSRGSACCLELRLARGGLVRARSPGSAQPGPGARSGWVEEALAEGAGWARLTAREGEGLTGRGGSAGGRRPGSAWELLEQAEQSQVRPNLFFLFTIFLYTQILTNN